MAARQHLLTADDIAGLLSECEVLRERVADLLDVQHGYQRTIRELRAQLVTQAPATTLDGPEAIPR